MPTHRGCTSRQLTVRGLRYHVREWGAKDAEPEHTLWMLHGWMDVSASFQFVVDALQPHWRVLAPDWRGFGLSDRAPADSYWFPDYLGDLDVLTERLTPGVAVNLVGHSMGGNIAMLYAGVRPRRVATVVNLEGVGLRATRAEEAPHRLALWLDQLAAGARLRDYATLEDVASRLRSNNPRLSAARAAFLAPHWAHAGKDGRYQIAGDPAHRIVNPVLYRLDEMLECWRRIECPVLWVLGEHSDVLKHVASDAVEARRELDRRRAVLADVESAQVSNAGHMLHHDEPQQVARLIEDFVGRRSPSGD